MTKRITTSALMLALATVLAMIPLFQLPFGGTVTMVSMLPVIVVAMLYSTGWGLFTAFVFALLQMTVAGGITAPPVQNFTYYAIEIALDYVIAFTVLGLSGAFYRMLGRKLWAIPVSAAVVIILRFVCHFLSGIIIWSVYAPEVQASKVCLLTRGCEIVRLQDEEDG